MIKILFEVSEDFIRESASHKTATAKINAENDIRVTETLFDRMAFISLENLIDEGKTEFVVNPDKLEDESKELYNNAIEAICLLATFSEIDNMKEESDE